MTAVNAYPVLGVDPMFYWVALALLTYNISLEGDEACEDDYGDIYKKINVAVNGLQRRWRQLRENRGNLDQATRIQQFRERQANLRKLLHEANTRGCLRYRTETWTLATIEYGGL